jgi:hypothetical protein
MIRSDTIEAIGQHSIRSHVAPTRCNVIINQGTWTSRTRLRISWKRAIATGGRRDAYHEARPSCKSTTENQRTLAQTLEKIAACR